jgi:hypothetical protein
MLRRTVFKSTLYLLATYLLSTCLVWAAEGIISKVPDSTGKYCHLKFPAMREDTLSWKRPVLKDPKEGDIVDFYGACDYDPLGKEEIQRQKLFLQRERNNYIHGDA